MTVLPGATLSYLILLSAECIFVTASLEYVLYDDDDDGDDDDDDDDIVTCLIKHVLNAG